MVDHPTIPLDDIRQEDPGSDRQGAFKRGWTAAVKDLSESDTTSKYAEGPPPERLTWDNLGYRLGCLFNETDDDLRQELFQWCVKKQNRELQRPEPSQRCEQTRMSATEKIEPSGWGIGCEYCPHTIQSVTIPEEKAEKLQDRSIPPTHIEIECPECENDFYYTQDRWHFPSDKKGVFSVPEREKRKTSPGKNVYIPKEVVVQVK